MEKLEISRMGWISGSFLLFSCVFWQTGEALAGIATDGTVGQKLTLSGPDFTISDSLGTVKGSNLFHSFSTFSIGKTESATFTGPDSISNVISRVTGGEVSNIDGLLKSEVGKADFYFINPAGIVFGANAKVDVPAAFHAGTADEIRFSDGSVFSAIKPETSTLSVSAPESFGFLSPQPGNLVVNGSSLTFQPGSTVSLAAGSIEIDKAKINVPAGEIKIASVGDSAVSVPFSGDLPGNVHGGLNIADSHIETTGDGGGLIRFTGGATRLLNSAIFTDNNGTLNAAGGIKMAVYDLEVNGSTITTDAMTEGSAGDMDITASNHVEISNNGVIGSSAFGNGNAGVINLTAKTLTIDGHGNFTGIASDAGKYEEEPSGTILHGNSGNINITISEDAVILNGGSISSFIYTNGNAGSLNLAAKNLKIDGLGCDEYTTGITTTAWTGSKGMAGDINVNVTEHAAILNGGTVSSSTLADGNAGTVSLFAKSLKLDGQGSFAGIDSNAIGDCTGKTGDVIVKVDGQAELINGGAVSNMTDVEGSTSSVMISAENLRIDGQNGDYSTGISSDAGKIEIKVADSLEMLAGGEISRSSSANGNEAIAVTARSFKIDGQNGYWSTGIVNNATSTDNSIRNIDIKVDETLYILNGGLIRSSTYKDTNSGSMSISARDMEIDRQGNQYFTGIASDGGIIDIKIAHEADILNGATISSSTYTDNNAEMISLSAENLKIDGKGSEFLTGITNSAEYNKGSAGNVNINVAGTATILNGGLIRSSTFSDGDAGVVTISARNLEIDRQGNKYFTGIASDTKPDSTGNAGSVNVQVADRATIINGGAIRSSTYSTGNAGSIVLAAHDLEIDRKDSAYLTGITSSAEADSTGNAGSIKIYVDDGVKLLNGGEIRSSTFSDGNAGTVTLYAKNLHINGLQSEYASQIASSTEHEGCKGNAGSVDVNVAETVEIMNGATISSATFSDGDAGMVTLTAGNLKIDRQNSQYLSGITSSASTGSKGNAGSVNISIADTASILNGGGIYSATSSDGNAGTVTMTANKLIIDGRGSQYLTGITSSAEPDSHGNGGNVNMTVADTVTILNGGEIRSATFSSGDAGAIKLSASNLVIDGQGSEDLTCITSLASPEAIGLAGRIAIQADQVKMMNAGEISIGHFGVIPDDKLATFTPGIIKINAGTLAMSGSSAITAESTMNAPASSIDLNISDRLLVTGGSRITTQANTSNGGAIIIAGNGFLLLNDGQITTSTNGGNGGDITLKPSALVMDTGFVQANTAEGAKGGNIYIDTPYLITPHATMPEIGGDERREFVADSGINVIQAAAPGGEQGNITITSPDMNISGALASIHARELEPAKLADDPCRNFGTKNASTLYFETGGGELADIEMLMPVSLQDESSPETLYDQREVDHYRHNGSKQR